MKKEIMNRTTIAYSWAHSIGTMIVFFAGFSGLYYLNGIYEPLLLFGFGFLPPLAVSVFFVMLINDFNKESTITVDANINTDLVLGAPLVGDSLNIKHYYYPSINRSYTPILSVGTLVNTQTLAIAGVFLFFSIIIHLVSGLITKGFVGSFIMVAICLVVSAVWAAALSVITLVKLLQAKRSGLVSDNFVSMKYTEAQIESLLSKQPITYYLDRSVARSKTQDVMKKLFNDGYDAAFRLNNLIYNGYANGSLMTVEKEVIEHVINHFIADSINTSIDYFKKHKDNLDSAKRVHRNEIEPRVESSAIELNDKLITVRQTIRAIEDQVKEEIDADNGRLKSINDSKINVEGELARLGFDKQLPVPHFQEFHTLRFDNEQNKVAATNIVKNSLPTLINAKKNTDSAADHIKLDTQIKKVHQFVRSIATNTTESDVRKAKLLALEKANPLYLEGNNTDINSTDNIIAINDRYLDSYDNTLPTSKD